MGVTKGILVYTLYGASLALSWAGLRLFYERRVFPMWTAILAVMPGLIYGSSLAAGASTAWGLTLVFGTIAVSTGLCIREIVDTPASARLWTQYIVLLGFGGYFFAFILSIGIVHFDGERLASPDSGVYSLLFDQWCGVFIQVGYLAMVSERAHLKLSRLAETDPLTGLANRRGLFAAMERKRSDAISRPRCAVVMADIDHFKAINDAHGHDGGDAVLVAFAERLRSVLRKEDIVARWGGEEFLIVLHGADAAASTAAAERLRKTIADRAFAIGGRSLIVTTSIGVSVMEADETRIDAALARADSALYAAKKAGRNRVGLELAPVPPTPDARATRGAGIRGDDPYGAIPLAG